MLRINLGAGRQAYEHPGYISVDIIKTDGIDIVWDCNLGLPRDVKYWSGPGFPHGFDVSPKVFGDNTVDEFLCKHFLEHLSTDGFMRIMDEIHDALKPGGILHILVPNGEHIRAAHSDPTHRKVFTRWTFDYFTKESLAAFPYTTKAWRILDGPKINGSEGDWWEIEVKMTPDK